jgi:transcription elongation GreA/GreB family factor
VILENYVAQNSFIDVEKDGETIQTIEKVATVQTKIFANDVVKLNSKVQVKYVNNGKDISIHIVSTENNKTTIRRIQKVLQITFSHSLLDK